jgi:hypothetical protein
MIDKLEIADLARELSLDLHIVEKDYVLGWLLAGSCESRTFGKLGFQGRDMLEKMLLRDLSVFRGFGFHGDRGGPTR